MADEEPMLRAFLAAEKVTMNTVRYQEIVKPGKKPRIGQIYLPKASLQELGTPEIIELTVRRAVNGDDIPAGAD